MKIRVRNTTENFNTYRAARVKSLFNAEDGSHFSLDADLDIEDADWRIGVIVGPSGSGKTSIGRQLWNGEAFWKPEWPHDEPIVDAIAPEGDFNAVTGALAAVGLGTVPAWLRPYHALSNGEQFRADMARLVSERPSRAIVDEFTSVVDRQIAKFGALAFAKSWRRAKGQVVLLTPHYDVLDWLEPDWVFDTGTGAFARDRLRRRPPFDLDIWQTNPSYWPAFKPHYYLELPLPVAASYYVGTVDGELVAHLAVATMNKGKGKGNFEGRATRLVVMPEWQGAGVGMRFLNAICQMWWEGHNRWGSPVTTVFHTSHPGLVAGLRRHPRWRQVSAAVHGANKAASARSLRKSSAGRTGTGGGFGGHFRAIQGFRYYGTKETFNNANNP